MRANIYALTVEAIGVLILTLAVRRRSRSLPLIIQVSGVTAWVAVDLDAVIASGKLLAGACALLVSSVVADGPDLTVFMAVSILVTPVQCVCAALDRLTRTAACCSGRPFAPGAGRVSATASRQPPA